MPRSLSLSLTLGFALLAVGCDRESGEQAQQQENSAANKESELTGTIDRSKAGSPLPEVTLVDPSGTTLALADLTGQPVLVNLWATWCVPCITEMPMLDAIAAENQGKLRVLTISQDMKGAEAVQPFFAERGFKNLPQWMDERNDLAFAYGANTVLPLTVLYDAEGKEVWRMQGGYDWQSAEAKALLAEAGGKPAAGGR